MSASPSISGSIVKEPMGENGGSDDAKNFSRTPTSWDASDDILLMHLKDQQKLGWKEIASHFDNRTPNACQFRWRRLKSGNLKNPPKSASSLGSGGGSSGGKVRVTGKNGKNGSAKGTMKYEGIGGGSSSGFAAGYSPITTSTFTGYDNNVSSALAGLNALSNTPSNISSPMPHYHMSTTPTSTTPGLNSPIGSHTSNSHANYDNSPKSEEVSLDPQSHGERVSNSGGYYADISVDPTMNLPHNQTHPSSHSSGQITPRGSASNASNNVSSNSGLGSGIRNNNSIIQIVREERTSVSSTRASVSSLPSKSMNIPHHQSHNSSLAHLPILFGGNSISGPSRNPSIGGSVSNPPTNVSSIRNSSIVGNGSGYYSRSGSVVVPFSSDKRDENYSRPETKKKDLQARDVHNKSQISKTDSSNSQPMFKLPWSMDEDELLINRRHRELSFAELSILLPQRTEGEIWTRIDHLEKLKNGHRSSSSRDHRIRRRSSMGLDDVDDLYDDVDDVIGSIDSDEDDENDILTSVNEASALKKKRKRRSSSAVNLTAVTESIPKRVR